MHTIDFIGKAYIMYVDFETILGTTVLENIVIRNGKKHSPSKVSCNQFAKSHSMRAIHASLVYVPTCQKHAIFLFLHTNLPTYQ